MAENNYNTIKPVDGLGNIARMESADRRQQRKKGKKKKNALSQNETQLNEQNQQDIDQNNLNQDENHAIDYRA
jgi:hypothetical protein